MYLDVNLGLCIDSDEELMSEIALGADAALHILFTRHRAYLRSIILKIVRDKVETDDILQEIFVEIWKRAGSYTRQKGRALGWMVTLTRRRATDHARKNALYSGAKERYRSEYSELITEEHIQVETDDLRSYLSMLLSRLPSQQRIVLETIFFQGLTQRETAQQMSIPLGTVRTRMELGMRKLIHIIAPARHKVA